MVSRRRIALLAIAGVTPILIWLAWHYTSLHIRSQKFQRELSEALVVGARVPLFKLIDERLQGAESACIIGPYANARNFLPADAALGLDDWWLSMIDERSIAVVIIAKAGLVLEVFRLNRLQLDLRPYGWPSECIGRDRDPQFQFIQLDPQGRILVQLELKGDQ